MALACDSDSECPSAMRCTEGACQAIGNLDSDAGDPSDAGDLPDGGDPEDSDAGEPDGGEPDAGPCLPENEQDWHPDADSDGFGNPNGVEVRSCEQPLQHVANALDCNDDPSTGALINPDVSEVPADGVDQDCDGVDDCFVDGDGDGFGTSETTTGTDLVCDRPANGMSSLEGDCNDADPAVHPGVADVFHDGLDKDCQSDDDYDEDGDGYVLPEHVDLLTYVDSAQTLSVPGTGLLPGGDCDGDQNTLTNPGEREILSPQSVCLADGLDNDCDGAADDADRDCADADLDEVPNGVDLIQTRDRVASDGLPDSVCVLTEGGFGDPWSGEDVVFYGTPAGDLGGFLPPLPLTQVISQTEIADNPGHAEWCLDVSVFADGNYHILFVSALSVDGLNPVDPDDCADWQPISLNAYCNCYEFNQTSCGGSETFCRTVTGTGSCPSGRGIAITVAGGVITGTF